MNTNIHYNVNIINYSHEIYDTTSFSANGDQSYLAFKLSQQQQLEHMALASSTILDVTCTLFPVLGLDLNSPFLPEGKAPDKQNVCHKLPPNTFAFHLQFYAILDISAKSCRPPELLNDEWI